MCDGLSIEERELPEFLYYISGPQGDSIHLHQTLHYVSCEMHLVYFSLVCSVQIQPKVK
jgi:hypothetical protein